ncbi:MAG TPA: PadR family transcriptional regulator [Acidobacteriota bacterium]|nr:PadR family transcriptional regulator [Acidobacteriota bacterium]
MDIGRHLPLTHLSFLILMALQEKPRHGYSIIKTVGKLSQDRLSPGTGTFYSALHRMQDEALLAECPAPEGSKGDSRRRYYELTDLGEAVLQAEAQRLDSLLVEARRRKILTEGRT